MYKVDLNNPPILSEEQKARLEALDKRPDSEIDFSDIPELDDSFWKNAVQNPFKIPELEEKIQLTVKKYYNSF